MVKEKGLRGLTPRSSVSRGDHRPCVPAKPPLSLRVFGCLPDTGARGCTAAGVRKASIDPLETFISPPTPARLGDRGKMRQAAEAAVRPDEDRAARLSASARSTGGFNRLRARDARFAVAQDARGSDPSLATTRNPVNVGSKASGRKAPLASTTWSGRIRSGSTRRDRDPHFDSGTCGLGHILPGSKTI